MSQESQEKTAREKILIKLANFLRFLRICIVAMKLCNKQTLETPTQSNLATLDSKNLTSKV